MRKLFPLLFALSILLTANSSIAYSGCLEDRHPVALDNGNVIQLRSYACSSSDVQLRVEFHRLADVAASILLTGKSSARLREIVGIPRIIENEVFASYSALLRRFGSSYEVANRQFSVAAEAGGNGGSGSGSDSVSTTTIRVLTNPYGSAGGSYPAMAEYEAVQSKIIPPNMKYFYTVTCRDEGRDRDKPVCSNFDPSQTVMNFWRSMRADDITKYAERTRIFNKRFMAGTNDSDVSLPADLQLLSYLAGNNWPANFSILVGNTLVGCSGGGIHLFCASRNA